MVKSDYSNYNCSDSITNEIIKKGNENNNKLMKYNIIAFSTDLIFIAGNLIAFLIIILDWVNSCKKCNEFSKKLWRRRNPLL